MKKLVVFTFFLSLAPLVTFAQGDPYTNNPYSNESQSKANQDKAVAGEQARTQNGQNISSQTYGRYNQYGDYIPGTHPGDTPYNTWPGVWANKRQMDAWRHYRDNYKANKAAEKKARKARRNSR